MGVGGWDKGPWVGPCQLLGPAIQEPMTIAREKGPEGRGVETGLPGEREASKGHIHELVDPSIRSFVP